MGQLLTELNTAVDTLMQLYEGAADAMNIQLEEAFMVQSTEGTLDRTKSEVLLENRRLRTSSVGVDADAIEDASNRAREAVEKATQMISVAQTYVEQVNA